MKKILSIIIVILMVGFLVGCTSNSNSVEIKDLAEWETLTIQNDVDELHLPNGQAYWKQKTGQIIEIVDNNIVKTGNLPKGSIYVGYSVWAGYLFQFGNKLYSVFQENSEEEVILVSKDVIAVIGCNEYLTSDAFSNPLLLMKNGDIKGYITWEKDLVDYPVKEIG